VAGKIKLELTWIGKESRPRLEPRILLEDPERSYHAPHRITDHDIFDNRLIFGDNLLAHVSKGFTTLRPNNYSAPVGESERDFRSPVSDKHDIRKMLFSGFRKCLYRVQKFDSDSERRFAVVLENDREVIKWFKPARGNFQIHYTSEASYEPDFVAETRSAKFLCEAKSVSEIADKQVQDKARAALQWCKNATAHELKYGGKPWSYLLVPHDIISDNKTLRGLAASCTYNG